MKLHAAEQDADDTGDVQDAGQNSGNQGDGTGGEHEDAGDEGDDNSSEDDGVGGTDDTSQRSAIEQRAETERLARERGQLEGERMARDRADRERQQREDQRREEELMASMDETQRTQYLLAKEVKVAKDGQNATRLLVQSSTDQNKFTRTLTKKPEYSKFEDEVESRHQTALSQGAFIARDVILAHLIGEQALKGTATRAQEQRGARRIQSQRQGGAQRTRGDQTGARTSGKSVVERAETENWAI